MTGRLARSLIFLAALAVPALVHAECGDGTLDELEQCDDGNLSAGDCCATDCTFESAETVCRAAASACDVAETCTGSSDVCPDDVVKPAGTPDASCDACESCNGQGACGIGPVLGCKVPTESVRSKLAMKNRTPDDGDVLEWKWLKGQETVAAEYGDPVLTTDYRLCLFDLSGESPALFTQSAAPAAGNCTSKPCWKALGKVPGSKGYRYNDKEATPDGLKQMTMTPGIDGAAKVVLKATGVNLALPIVPGPVPLPIRVQLHASNGTCFQATYSTAEKNDAGEFKANAD
jgi:cysteine-rich repeat protein